jgi:RNA polymerase sigma-54 factor
VALLNAAGIDIARRTVAKYREGMGIPSSVERRRLKSSLPGG